MPSRPPLPAPLVCRGDRRLLHRPRRQRAGARLRLLRGRKARYDPGRRKGLTKDWETGARDALVKSSAIEPCRAHFDIYLRTHDKDAERRAYAIGTNMLKSGEVRDVLALSLSP